MEKLDLAFTRAQMQAAREFLAALGGGHGGTYTFQTFVDRSKGDPPPAKDDARSRILTGTFDEVARQLVQLNRMRAGVFVTVNPQRGNWRANANTIKPRAIWHENDGTILDSAQPEWPVEPSMIVRTRENHTHIYWMLSESAGTRDEWQTWEGIERHLVEHYASDKRCQKRCQVLRVPGFYHVKDPSNPRLVTIEKPYTGKRYALSRIEQAFPPIAGHATIEERITQFDLDTHGIADLPLVNDVQWRDVVAMLEFVNPDAATEPSGDGNGTRTRWLRTLMALEETKHPDRRLVADEWSRCGGMRDRVFPVGGPVLLHRGYVEGEVEHQMASFKRATGNKVGLGTLIRYAREGGWPGWTKPEATQDEVDAALEASDSVAVRVDVFEHTGGDEALITRVPPQNFLLDGFMSGEGTLSAILGVGGSGKSKLVKAIACAVATGTPLCGYRPVMPHEVGAAVIADLENNKQEFTRRLQDHARAMIEHNVITADEAPGMLRNVRHLYIKRMIFELAFQQHGMPLRHSRHYNALHDELSKARDACSMGVRWLCFDALYKFHLLNENDQQHMVYALEVFDEIATKVFGEDVPRSFVHHSAKGNTATSHASNTGASARGASSIEAALRSSVVVRHLTKDEMQRYCIAEDQHRDFAIVYVNKSNFRVMKPDWFMVRAFGAAWWHVPSDLPTHGEVSEEYLNAYGAFLVNLYELIERRKVSMNITSARRQHAAFLRVTGKQLDEFLGRAEQEGHIGKGSRGNYRWTNAAPNPSFAQGAIDDLV